MLRDNNSLVEYIYVVLSLGTDDGSVHELYRRQFGWLPVHRVVLLAPDGRPLLGGEHGDLAARLLALHAERSAPEGHFYFQGAAGLELVAYATVRYRSQILGYAAITRAIDRAWLMATREAGGGHLFLVAEGRVAISSADAALVGLPFAPANNVLTLRGEGYLVRPIVFAESPASLPTLWFGLADAGSCASSPSSATSSSASRSPVASASCSSGSCCCATSARRSRASSASCRR